MVKIQKINLVLDPSPWPVSTAFSLYVLIIGLVASFHLYSHANLFIIFGFFLFISVFSLWIRDILRDAFIHRIVPILSGALRRAFILFIVSEVMFFVAFFWAFFHSSLAPVFQIGSIWPPLAFSVFSPWSIPLVNTMILLTSGATTTWVQYAIVAGDYDQVVYGFVFTLVLSFLFLDLQIYEYVHASFSISDGIYGSTFYMLTGFHGFHVLVGTIMLTVSFFRFLLGQMSPRSYLGFTVASWYWHFVDVVWILLFLVVYIWGNSMSNNIVLF